MAVGLFDRLRRLAPEPANVPSDWLTGSAWRTTWEAPRNVAVESHYQEAFIEACGPVCKQGYLIPVEVQLVRHPSNEYDPNAIAVMLGPGGAHLGYLRREVAAKIAPAVDRARIRDWTVAGVIRGGTKGRYDHFGVHLWLDRRMSPGPDVKLGPGLWEVPWPPGGDEVGRARAALAGAGRSLG